MTVGGVVIPEVDDEERGTRKGLHLPAVESNNYSPPQQNFRAAGFSINRTLEMVPE